MQQGSYTNDSNSYFLFIIHCHLYSLCTILGAFVSDELVLDFSNEKDGEWLVETQTDRILFFSFPDSTENLIHRLLKDSLMV